MEEIWKIIPNSNNTYEVSNLGEVRRVVGLVKNNINGGSRKVGGKILSQKTKKNNYKEVNLYFEPQISKMMYVHRLVAMAFIGEIKDGFVVNHKDGNKGNNNVSNLEIVTYSQNSHHSYHVLNNKNPVYRGEESGNAKLTNNDVVEIRNLYSEGMFPSNIVKLFPNISYSNICKICYKAIWKHI